MTQFAPLVKKLRNKLSALKKIVSGKEINIQKYTLHIQQYTITDRTRSSQCNEIFVGI